MITLSEFYFKYKKHILLAQGYTEEKQLEFIIKACRLKPLEAKNNKWKPKIELYRCWIDEYGNSLNLKKKTIKIIQNDLMAQKQWVDNIGTDLYSGLGVEKVIRISKLIYLFLGKEKDNINHYIISFLGMDNYLRTFIYLDGEWKTYPSLLLEMKTLSYIGRYQNIDNYKELKQNYQIILPCEKQSSWLCSLPANDEFLELIKENNLPNLEFLKI